MPPQEWYMFGEICWKVHCLVVKVHSSVGSISTPSGLWKPTLLEGLVVEQAPRFNHCRMLQNIGNAELGFRNYSISMKSMEGRSRFCKARDFPVFHSPPATHPTCFWTPDNKFSRLSPICRARLVAGVGTLLSESATGARPGRSSFSFKLGTNQEKLSQEAM